MTQERPDRNPTVCHVRIDVFTALVNGAPRDARSIMWLDHRTPRQRRIGVSRMC